MKLRRLFLLSVCATAVVAGYLLWPTVLESCSQPVSSGNSELSSTAAPANLCQLYYEPKKGVFDTIEFLTFKANLQSKEKITDEDIRNSLNKPEHFLGVIEALSAQEHYEGLNFSQKIKDLSVKELRKLNSKIKEYTNKNLLEQGVSVITGKPKTKDQLSVLELPALLVDVYRIMYRPKGFWRNLTETKKLSAAFEKLDDAKIQERLQMALFTDTMEQTFDVIVKDRNLKSRFTNLVRENSAWVDTSVFVALWGTNVGSKMFLGMEVDPTSMDGFIQLMPLYLMGTGRPTKISISKKDLETARTKGLQAAQQEMKEELKPLLAKGRMGGVAKWTYAAIFSSLFVSTVTPDVNRLYEQYQQENNPAGIVTVPEKTRIEEPRYTSDVDLRAIADFNQYVRILKEQGVEVDLNSAEMKAVKQERIDLYRRTYNGFNASSSTPEQ